MQTRLMEQAPGKHRRVEALTGLGALHAEQELDVSQPRRELLPAVLEPDQQESCVPHNRGEGETSQCWARYTHRMCWPGASTGG